MSYRSYSPSETNSVAVVPSPQSYRDNHHCLRSPPQIFDEFDQRPAKQICLDQVTGYPFGLFQDTLASSPDTTSSRTSSPGAQYIFGGSTATGSFDVFNEDSKVGLNFLQGAMQQQQLSQQPQMPTLAGQASLSAAAIRKEEYSLTIHQEPEQYYRARYETEGIRGPLKGQDNNHPAVRVVGPLTYSGTVKVMLVHEDGTKHTSCFLDETKERQKALTKKIDPNSNMVVEFEDLRIRRETKSKNYKEGGRKADKAKSTRNDKTACLRFTATLHAPGQDIELIVLSRPIQLCSPPEGAELEWLIPECGHANGEEKVVIKGTKMTCPKVTFTVLLPEGHHLDLPAHVDKEQSHQNVLVVKTPRLPDELRNYQGSHFLKAEVRVSSGRAGTCSTPLAFFYIPNGVCHTCKQSLPSATSSMPVQPGTFVPTPSFLLPQCTHNISIPFTGCSTPSPQHAQPGSNPLPPFNEITSSQLQPRMMYTPQYPEIVSTHSALSHPPSVSTPSPIPSASSQKDSIQLLFEGNMGNVNTSQSPTISPTSSPGPDNSYWNDITPTIHPGPVISQSQDIDSILPEFSGAPTSASMQVVASPGSEPGYGNSAVPSPDTTTSIFPSYSYIDNPNAPYPYTS